MTTNRLHPFSVAAGLALALVLVSLTSFGNGVNSVKNEKTIRVSLDPDPASIVRIDESGALEVPAHRILVVKSLFTSGFVNHAELLINGTPVFESGTPPNPLEFAFPITAQAGDTVSVQVGQFDSGTVFAVGYLADP